MFTKNSIFCTLLLFLNFITLAQIQLLNDEFNDSSSIINWHNINETEGWNIQQLEWHNINDSMPGQLQMAPYTASWFGGYRGPLIYREVTGDFVFSTHIVIHGRSGDFPTSDFDFNLAGVMCRIPQDYPNGAYGVGGWQETDQNYIFLAIGGADDGNFRCDPSPNPCVAPHLEVKTTINGSSVLDIEDIDSPTIEFRFVRIDAVFFVMYKLPSDTDWSIHRRYFRNDFPETVQIGFVTYTDWDKVSSYTPEFQNSHTLNADLNPDPTPGVPFNPDVIGDFDYARFDSVIIPPAFIGLNFFDPSVVSDANILSFLGYDSEAFCPTTLHIHSKIDSNTYVRMTANEIISIDTAIMTKSIVHLIAGNEVTLQPGFQVSAGATFTASIGTCTVAVLKADQKPNDRKLAQISFLDKSVIELTVSPNPFSFHTNIHYHLTQEEEVSLAIYNLNGRLINKLLDKEMQAKGGYHFSFQMANQQKGMYVLVLQTGQRIYHQKILFVE